jgi:hypothetical protein
MWHNVVAFLEDQQLIAGLTYYSKARWISVASYFLACCLAHRAEVSTSLMAATSNNKDDATIPKKITSFWRLLAPFLED